MFTEFNQNYYNELNEIRVSAFKTIEQIKTVMEFHSLDENIADTEDLSNLDDVAEDLQANIHDFIAPLMRTQEELREGGGYPKGELSIQQLGLKSGRLV